MSEREREREELILVNVGMINCIIRAADSFLQNESGGGRDCGW